MSTNPACRLLTAGQPAKLWRAVVDQRVEIVTCPLLQRSSPPSSSDLKFRAYAPAEEARAFFAEVAPAQPPRPGSGSHRVPDLSDRPPVSRDPNDDYLFALAPATAAPGL